jgi:hypothetical protein
MRFLHRRSQLPTSDRPELETGKAFAAGEMTLVVEDIVDGAVGGKETLWVARKRWAEPWDLTQIS